MIYSIHRKSKNGKADDIFRSDRSSHDCQNQDDPSLSGDATEEEIQFLKKLQFRGRRPTALYYYRELQNLRDPVHFREA